MATVSRILKRLGARSPGRHSPPSRAPLRVPASERASSAGSTASGIASPESAEGKATAAGPAKGWGGNMFMYA